MAKDAFYFSHDANASQDPKMLKMRSRYGWEGYGWYWALVEMMRQEEEYCLRLDFIDAFAMHLQCDGNALISFINFCAEVGLFVKNETVFFSNSLRRRMESVDEKREKARQSAIARWGDNQGKNANAMRTQCERNAKKKSKEKESKVDKSIYGEFQNVRLTEIEHQKLIDKFGDKTTFDWIEKLSSWLKSNGKSKKDHYATILSWDRRDGNKDARFPAKYPTPEEL